MTRFNLLPPVIERRRLKAALMRRIGGMSVGFGLLLLIYIVAAVFLLRSINADAEHARDQIAHAEHVRSQHEAKLAAYHHALDLIDLQRRLRTTVPAGDLLALFSQVTPDGVYLSSIHWTESPVVLPTSAKKSGKRGPAVKVSTTAGTCRIEGVARNDRQISLMIERLSHQHVFDNVRLSRSEQVKTDDVTLHQFQITLTMPTDRCFERVELAGGPSVH